MKLTGQNVQQICDALLDAYPTRDLLRMMVRVELDRNLEEIAGGENQNVVIFNLVSWAERDGRIDELIERAHLRTPGNAPLRGLAAEWRAQASPGAPPQIVSPLARTVTGPTSVQAERTGPASVDLFLSYSRKDIDAMHLVQEALRAAGLSVWTDEGLEPGTQSWKDAIAEAVKQAYALVVLLSPNSAHSTWVKNEVGFAQTLRKRVFPLLIAGEAATAVPIDLINSQWVDGRENLERTVAADLVPALRRHQASVEMLDIAPPVAAGKDVAVPAAVPVAIPASAPVATPHPARAAGEGSRYVVQLGAFSSAGVAADGWNRATRRFDFLKAYDGRQAKVSLSKGTFYRLSFSGFASRDDANRTCARIKSNGGNCFVRAMDGADSIRWASNSTKRGQQLASR